MEKVRVGYVGCGRLSTRHHYPNIVRIPEIELVACCDLKEDLARHHARAYGALRWYTDARKMFESEELDAAIVVGPPQMHTEIGAMALEHGLHLFTEKPIAVSLEEAKRLVELAEKSGKFTQVGHMMRHATAVRMAKKLMSQPEFGKVTFIESKYFTGPSSKAWGITDPRWCYMLVQAIHPIDLARHLGGEIVRVAATECHGENDRGAYSVCVNFESGTAGFLNLNGSFPGWSTRVEITGDAGSFIGIRDMVELEYLPTGGWLKGGENEGLGRAPFYWKSTCADDGSQRMGYFNEMVHFARSIISNTPPYPSFRDAYRAMVVCRAILDSVEKKAVVEVPKD